MNVVELIKSSAPLPSGSYIAEIAEDPPPRSANGRGRLGVGLTLKVVEGPAKGRVTVVELFVHPSGTSRVDRDLDVLLMWCDCLGVDNADTLIALIERLREAAASKRLEFTFRRNEWAGGIELHLTAVRMAQAQAERRAADD